MHSSGGEGWGVEWMQIMEALITIGGGNVAIVVTVDSKGTMDSKFYESGYLHLSVMDWHTMTAMTCVW